MKFSTVQIRPAGYKLENWEVSFSDLPGDRLEEKHYPHSLGFYHYPRYLGKQKAFEILQEFLILKYEKEITFLTKSLTSLKKMKLIEEQYNCISNKCSALQYSDQMVCEKCKQSWDMNDTSPPACENVAIGLQNE